MMNTVEENYKFLEVENQKLKRDLAIKKRDMRIIEKELARIYRYMESSDLSSSEISLLLGLIRLLKQR
jgi:hypothetical protein